jgi:hypothetical protein
MADRAGHPVTALRGRTLALAGETPISSTVVDQSLGGTLGLARHIVGCPTALQRSACCQPGSGFAALLTRASAAGRGATCLRGHTAASCATSVGLAALACRQDVGSAPRVPRTFRRSVARRRCASPTRGIKLDNRDRRQPAATRPVLVSSRRAPARRSARRHVSSGLGSRLLALPMRPLVAGRGAPCWREPWGPAARLGVLAPGDRGGRGSRGPLANATQPRASGARRTFSTGRARKSCGCARRPEGRKRQTSRASAGPTSRGGAAATTRSRQQRPGLWSPRPSRSPGSAYEL